ncbi:MAG: NADH dehydrogenase (quinone) subunit G [Candidatus Actinomarinales bacterium]|nr:MAG: NADH dehydrogenase (quinone) subunit G [Candidatus Actinomarinales bacterium]
MSEKVNLNVNGIEIESDPNKLLIEACEDSGIHIPRFCWHKRLDPVGMCRMCLVEVETPRGKMLVPSCTTEVSDEMVVDTESDVVKKAQEGVLEFLLINHPLDCPICDKAGECPLQDQTMAYGPGESRFVEEKRHFEKPINISEIILLDRERCILCARCTRFSDEISGDPLIEFIQRGNKTEVNTFPNEPFKSYFSGNTVQICPVGALTSTSYRFKARPWDLKSTRSTCNGCSMGCSIELNSSQNKMLRILGVDNDAVNQGWLCDKGRYNFEYLNSDSRLKTPLKKIDNELVEIEIQEVYSELSEVIKDRQTKVTFLLGSNLTNEDYVAFREFSEIISQSEKSFYLNDDKLHPGLFGENVELAKIDDLNSSDAIVVWAEDLKEKIPVLYLRIRQAVKNGVKLVVFGHTNETLSDIADVFYGKETVSENFEIVKDISKLKEIKDLVIGKNITAILGKSTPHQSDTSVTKLFEFLNSNSNSKVLNAYSKGNTYGALQTLENVKGLNNFVNDISEENTDLLFIVGADPIGRSVYSNQIKSIIEGLDTVVALDNFNHETSELANFLIPMSSTLGEKEGTFTNIEFRTSRIDKLVPSPGQTVSDWEFITSLMNFSGLTVETNSLESLNKKAYENLDYSLSPVFDNLDKPSNLDGMVNISKPKISSSDNNSNEAKFFIGEKLYGDSTTERHSDSISLLGSKKYIEVSEGVVEKYNLTSGKCTLIQDELEVTVSYEVNKSFPNDLIYIPTNRRELNKFDFSREIMIIPSVVKEALNVN